MLRSRIIPCLLIHRGGLVKTKAFKEPYYLGDPINAVKIFSEKEADELIIFDIDATVEGREPNFDLIAKVAAECRMPLCYGGGVSDVSQVVRMIDLGVEKVAVSSAAICNPELLTQIASAVGQQSVVAVLDIRKKIDSSKIGFEVCSHNAKVVHKVDPISLAIRLQNAGAGEIVINNITLDGAMQGYDVDMALEFRKSLKIPITFLGGAGSVDHISRLVSHVGIVGAAAGSMFVFKGKFKAVLINYPSGNKNLISCSVS